MANENVNKVELTTGEVLIDLTEDTVAEESLLEGYTAHDRSGARITGSAVPSVSADWNETDPSEKSYIRNKPFGPVSQQVTVIPESTLEFFANNSELFADLEGVSVVPEVVADDAEFTLTVDGVTSEVTGTFQEDDGDVWYQIGDPSTDTCTLYMDIDGTLWAIQYGSEYYAEEHTENHTVSIVTKNNITYNTKLAMSSINSPIIPGTGINSLRSLNATDASGDGSIATGSSTTASNDYAHAEGSLTTASGWCSHAEGAQTIASGSYAHAEGEATEARGLGSHSEGCVTLASGMESHAEGYNNVSSGGGSHAEGINTTASGSYSHAEGNYTTSSGLWSHAEGIKTISNARGMTAVGRYNEEASVYDVSSSSQNVSVWARDTEYHTGDLAKPNLTNSVYRCIQDHTSSSSIDLSNRSYWSNVVWDSDTLFVVGNGISDDSRSNALEVREDGSLLAAGDGRFSGDLYTGCNGSSAGGAKVATVDDVMIPAPDMGTPVLLVDTTVASFHKDGDNDWYCTNENPFQGLAQSDCVATNLFKIEWDGVEYEELAYDYQGLLTTGNPGFYYWRGIGDVSIIGYGDHYGSSAPFAVCFGFYRNAGELQIFTNSTEASHTIKITKVPFVSVNPYERFYRKYPGNWPVITNGTGLNSVIMGGRVIDASGESSIADGQFTLATGKLSHASGCRTVASGSFGAHAEGYLSKATADYSHAEGYNTTASGQAAHSEGYSTTASEILSHSEGQYSVASGQESHAEGEHTIANHFAQHALGMYNVADPSSAAATAKGNYVEIVGNGSADARSNAYALEWDGTAHYAGNVYVGCGADSTGGVRVATATDLSLKADKDNCVVTSSLSMGRGGSAGTNSTALGNAVQATGNYSFATGELARAQGHHASAEGYSTTASGESSHSEGNRTTASAFGAHAEGRGTVANNEGAHAQGRYNYNRPHADMMGIYDEIADYGAFVANKKYYWNDGVVENDKLYRCTQYIKPAEFDPEDDEHWEEVPADFADVVGGGTVYECANVYALDWFGNIFVSGNVYVDCDDHSNPGTRLARETITRNISGTTPTINGKDNVRYLCGEVATISITPPATGMCEVRFTSGTTAAVLTVPNTVHFPSWFDATSLDTSTVYEMNFSDGYGVVATWPA